MTDTKLNNRILNVLESYDGPVSLALLATEVKYFGNDFEYIFDKYIEHCSPYKHAIQLALKELKKLGKITAIHTGKGNKKEWVLR